MDARNAVSAAFLFIDDPRAANARHPLPSVLFSLLVGVICGADGFVQAAAIAQAKRQFISRFVELPSGVPTHDTMARVLGMIDPEQFAAMFATLMSPLIGRTIGDIINVDGKTLRGVVSRAAVKAASAEDQTHIVSAFSSLRGVVLAQVRSKSVANEVAAAQELLARLDLRRAVVTLDAAHTVRKTVSLICERDGDMVVSVKKNTSSLFKAIVDQFKVTLPTTVDETESGHGRIERRIYEVVPAAGKPVQFDYWPLQSFVRATRQRIHPRGRIAAPRVSYYATSLPPDAIACIAPAIRARWGIENRLHYPLDVTFDEDACRVRTNNAPENLSRMRHIAMNLIQLCKRNAGKSLPVKRLLAGMDDAFLAGILRLKEAR